MVNVSRMQEPGQLLAINGGKCGMNGSVRVICYAESRRPREGGDPSMQAQCLLLM